MWYDCQSDNSPQQELFNDVKSNKSNKGTKAQKLSVSSPLKGAWLNESKW